MTQRVTRLLFMLFPICSVALALSITLENRKLVGFYTNRQNKLEALNDTLLIVIKNIEARSAKLDTLAQLMRETKLKKTAKPKSVAPAARSEKAPTTTARIMPGKYSIIPEVNLVRLNNCLVQYGFTIFDLIFKDTATIGAYDIQLTSSRTILVTTPKPNKCTT